MRARNSVVVLALILAGCASESTYPEKCAALPAGWAKPSDGYGTLSVVTKVDLARDGSLKWNGRPVSEQKLVEYLQLISTFDPRPFNILEIEAGTPCRHVTRIRTLTDEKEHCSDYLPGRLGGEGPEPWAQISDVAPFENSILPT